MRRIYQIINVVVLIGFLLFFIIEDRNFQSLSETIDTYEKEIEEQRDGYEEIISSWEDSYDSLQTQYADLLKENDSLRKRSITISDTEIDALCRCVQSEAGATNYESQRLIVSVILNRVASEDFPDTVSEVIYQKSGDIPQFSVAYNGMMSSCEVTDLTYDNVMNTVTKGGELPSYVKYFYSESVDNNWVNTLTEYTRCEGTIFAYDEK